MRDVLFALSFHVGVLLGVVVAVRHAEPPLHCLRDISRTVLCVLAGAKVEKRIHADAVQVRDLRQHVLPIFDHVDPIQLLLQRLGAHRFDRLFVHSAGVIIAHLLCFRRELWVDLRLRCLLGNRVQRVVVALNQLVERAPSGIFRRDFCLFDPVAIGVQKKIVARLHRCIHVLGIEWRALPNLRLRLGKRGKGSG